MSDIAIRVENLGKLYRIGRRERYLALGTKLRMSECTLRMYLGAIRNPHFAIRNPTCHPIRNPITFMYREVLAMRDANVIS